MKKVQILLTLVCLGLSTGLAPAMNSKVDSLLLVLNSDAPGDKVEVLWGIAYELFDVDNSEALFYATRAYQEVWKNGDSLQIVKVGTTYGQLLRRMGQVEKSISTSARLLPISKRNDFKKYTKMLLNSLATAHIFIENYDSALEYHFESLSLRQEEGSKKEIAIALANIGLVNYKLGDFELSIEYLNQSIEMVSSVGDSTELGRTLVNIGASYTGLGQYKRAQESYAAALKTLQVSSDQSIIIGIEYGFAETYFYMGNMDSSKVHAHQSLTFAQAAKEQWFQIFSSLLLSKIAFQEGQVIVCDSYLSMAESVPALAEYPYAVLEIQRQRSKYYSRIRQFEKALNALENHVTLKELTFNDAIDKRVRSIQVEFNQRENLTKIGAQSRILKLQNDAIARQGWIIFLCIVVLLLTGCIAIVLYRSDRRKKRINLILDERVRERTVELGRQRDTLQHTVDEQLVSKRRVSEEVIALAATLKGLLYLGGREIPAGYTMYLQEAEATTEKITGVIHHYRATGKRYE